MQYPSAQSNLINDIEVVQRMVIVQEVCIAKLFTLIADETMDFSKQEQLSVCLWYVKDF